MQILATHGWVLVRRFHALRQVGVEFIVRTKKRVDIMGITMKRALDLYSKEMQGGKLTQDELEELKQYAIERFKHDDRGSKEENSESQ